MKKSLKIVMMVLAILLAFQSTVLLTSCVDTENWKEAIDSELSKLIGSPEESTEASSTEKDIADGPVLSQEMREKILAAYISKYKDQGVNTVGLSVKFVGEYHGAYAVFINGGFAYLAVGTSETVDDVTFRYPSSQRMLIFFEDSVVNLQGAFDSGVLTHDDLVTICGDYQKTLTK